MPAIRYFGEHAPLPGMDFFPVGMPQQNVEWVRVENGYHCVACRTYHPVGSCPLKLAGVEYCNLCGMAHFGSSRVCPHIQSETQVRAMLGALKESNEPEHIVAEARRYLRGVKGSLVQLKKHKEARAHAFQEAQDQAPFQATGTRPW